MNRFFSMIALALVVFALGTHPTMAQTTHCTAITSLPYTISSGGVYCVTKNLATSKSGILISANNVVVDLNGFTITQTSGTGNPYGGVVATSRKNITVRNGTIRGFYWGVILWDPSPFTISSGNVVEDMRITGSLYMGIQCYGAAIIIRNNQIINTGGSTDIEATQGKAFGIQVEGAGAEVSNNFIANTFGSGGTSTAISLYDDSDLAVNNRIVTADNGISTYISGECRDNIATAVTNKYPGCIDLGNNN